MSDRAYWQRQVAAADATALATHRRHMAGPAAFAYDEARHARGAHGHWATSAAAPAAPDVKVDAPASALQALALATGHPWTERAVAAVSGAPAGSEVSAQADGAETEISVAGSRLMARYTVSGTTLTVGNVFVPEEHQGKGIGTETFGRLVQAAAAQGLKSVKLTAERNGEENGYYTWARLGCDAPLPAAVARQAKRAGQGNVRHVSDLMATPEGRAWWKQNGVTLDMEMDLAPDSSGRRTLDAYLAETSHRRAP